MIPLHNTVRAFGAEPVFYPSRLLKPAISEVLTVDQKRQNFDDHETWGFTAQVISCKTPFLDDDRGWIIYVESSLDVGDVVTFVQFRFMGEYNVNDCYVVEDLDNGKTVYRFEVSECLPNQR